MQPIFRIPPTIDDTKRWIEAVQASGHQLVTEEGDWPTDRPILFVGSIEGLQQCQSTWLGDCDYPFLTWCDWDALKCSNYYVKWLNFILPTEYAFYPYEILCRRPLGLAAMFQNRQGEVFIRPDTNDKIFPGGVVNAQNLEIWLKTSPSSKVDSNTLCVIGSPADIWAEYRLWIADGRVITGSQYVLHNKLIHDPKVPQGAIEIAEAAAKLWSPHRIFVIDIAQEGSPDHARYSILECGSVHTCGLYAADPKPIVEAMARIAMEEFKTWLR